MLSLGLDSCRYVRDKGAYEIRRFSEDPAGSMGVSRPGAFEQRMCAKLQ
jgi:hypothetical protein